MLRAYSRYLAQLGLTPSVEAIAGYYLENPEVTATLVELFETGYDPGLNLSKDEALPSARKSLSN